MDWQAAEWSAFGSVGALAVAVIVGGFVAVQVLQAKRLREDQARPYVIVDFDFKGLFVHLVIKNIGATPARDVAVKFDRPLQTPGRARDFNDFEIFKNPIPMMAPGREIRVRFGMGPDFFKDEAEVSLSYRADVKYQDLHGKRKFVDPPLVLDLRPYKNTIVGADRLAEIADATKNLERTLRRWTGSGGSLEVRAIDRDRQERKQARADHWWELRHAYEGAGLTGVLGWQVSRWKHRLRP